MPTIENLFLNINGPRQSCDLTENGGIAVIGLSCRIGGTYNKDEYWDLIQSGGNIITTFPENRKNDNDAYCKKKD